MILIGANTELTKRYKLPNETDNTYATSECEDRHIHEIVDHDEQQHKYKHATIYRNDTDTTSTTTSTQPKRKNENNLTHRSTHTVGNKTHATTAK